MDKRLDFVCNLISLGMGVWLLHLSGQLGHVSWGDEIGPAGFPKALAYLLILMSLLVMCRQILKWRRAPGWKVAPEGAEDVPGFPVSIPRVFIFIMLAFAYIFSFKPLGLLISTPLYLVTSLFINGIRKAKQLVSVSIGFTVAIFIIFVILARVRFPLGPLDFISDSLIKFYMGV